MQIPPFLKPDSKIGITCPAGSVNLDEMKYMFNQLQDWGFQYVVGSTVGTSYHKFSATDEDRRQDFQNLLDDPAIDAIFFGRGGYGVVRILDQLDFSSFVRNPKWLVGFSDITALHSHIHTQFLIATLHAHMSGGYKPQYLHHESTQSIYHALTGRAIHYSAAPHSMNRIGVQEGQLVGGNLALLSDLIGTPSDIQTAGKILFIEDVSEYRYNVDRMLWQLKRAGKFSGLSGLIVGGFTDGKDDEIPFGMTEYEMIWEKVKEYDYPVCFDFPLGHQPANLALICGKSYQLQVSHYIVELSERG
jgi:muramoyltetrapeptide carboxypeptidase